MYSMFNILNIFAVKYTAKFYELEELEEVKEDDTDSPRRRRILNGTKVFDSTWYPWMASLRMFGRFFIIKGKI